MPPAYRELDQALLSIASFLSLKYAAFSNSKFLDASFICISILFIILLTGLGIVGKINPLYSYKIVEESELNKTYKNKVGIKYYFKDIEDVPNKK